jgi:DNA-directed RNA polymerase subunit RPC12/RpoP
MSIWGLTWPWRTKTKQGRTVERYDKIGRLRVLCANSGAPVTGEIEVQEGEQFRVIGGQIESRLDGTKSRWTRCPECNHKIRVTGLKSRPRLTVHNAYNLT